jgi:hypothetical protein
LFSCAGNPILDKAGQPLMVDADEGEEGEDDGKDEEEKKVRRRALCAYLSGSVLLPLHGSA